MKVPSSFKLYGQTITVNFKEDLHLDNQRSAGLADYNTNTITLKPRTDSYPVGDDKIEQKFWHELMHLVLYHAGPSVSKDIEVPCDDEGFVDTVSCLLHQAINSFEGECK